MKLCEFCVIDYRNGVAHTRTGEIIEPRPVRKEGAKLCKEHWEEASGLSKGCEQ